MAEDQLSDDLSPYEGIESLTDSKLATLAKKQSNSKQADNFASLADMESVEPEFNSNITCKYAEGD